MLAPLVVRDLGVPAKLPTSTLEGEIIERNRGGGREKGNKYNNKLPKLPTAVDSLIIGFCFNI